jgi:hypothetical protein
MSMINLEKCQAVSVGNIENVFHSATMQNGYVVNLGAKNANGAFAVSVPATATLGSAEALLIYNDGFLYAEGKTITDYSIAANEFARAYHLTVGDKVLFDATLLTGTPAKGKYLIPANGVMTLAVADDLTGATRLAFEIEDAVTTIGKRTVAGWRARVIKA